MAPMGFAAAKPTIGLAPGKALVGVARSTPPTQGPQCVGWAKARSSKSAIADFEKL